MGLTASVVLGSDIEDSKQKIYASLTNKYHASANDTVNGDRGITSFYRIQFRIIQSAFT